MDNDGRLLAIKYKFENSSYIIANCYTPTQQYRNDQLNFIKAGDFNFYLNPMMDKSDTLSHKHDNYSYRTELQVMLDVFNLTDTWRALNPNSRRYSWHARGKSSLHDYLFIFGNLLNYINECKINPGQHSDHSIMPINLIEAKNCGNLT